MAIKTFGLSGLTPAKTVPVIRDTEYKAIGADIENSCAVTITNGRVGCLFRRGDTVIVDVSDNKPRIGGLYLFDDKGNAAIGHYPTIKLEHRRIIGRVCELRRLFPLSLNGKAIGGNDD